MFLGNEFTYEINYLGSLVKICMYYYKYNYYYYQARAGDTQGLIIIDTFGLKLKKIHVKQTRMRM